jgi:hypothetical protein
MLDADAGPTLWPNSFSGSMKADSMQIKQLSTFVLAATVCILQAAHAAESGPIGSNAAVPSSAALQPQSALLERGKYARAFTPRSALYVTARAAKVSKPPACKFIYSPLWGDESFNIGAGMARTYSAAAFVKRNMPIGMHERFPLGQGGLSDQEAVDVSAYFAKEPRPDYPDKVNDWPKDKRPSDARY